MRRRARLRPSSRRRTPTTGWPTCARSPTRCPAGASTCRSARPATRRRPRWSRRWPGRTPSGATRRRWGPPRTARRPPAGSTGASGRRSAPAQRRRPASAPRSSSPGCRTGCGCATRATTPCSTPRSATRPTPWGRRWPGAGRCPTRSLDAVDPADAARALCLWVNSPANPSGELDDLPAAAAWGRARGVPVLSDECYIEFTWDGPGRTILTEGTDGVLAVHSLSKRSNLAGVRAGFYAGDAALVHYLSEVRKHAGFMVPGPVQAAGAVAFDDDDHVEAQRQALPGPARHAGRRADRRSGVPAHRPDGTFYLWVAAPGRRRLGPGPPPGRAGRRAGVAGRVLRARRGRPRPDRGGGARRPHRAGGRPPGRRGLAAGG